MSITIATLVCNKRSALMKNELLLHFICGSGMSSSIVKVNHTSHLPEEVRSFLHFSSGWTSFSVYFCLVIIRNLRYTLKVYNLKGLDICIDFLTHHHNQDDEHIHYYLKFPPASLQSLPPAPIPYPRQLLIGFVKVVTLHDFEFYINFRAYILYCSLLFFTHNNYFEILYTVEWIKLIYFFYCCVVFYCMETLQFVFIYMLMDITNKVVLWL